MIEFLDHVTALDTSGLFDENILQSKQWVDCKSTNTRIESTSNHNSIDFPSEFSDSSSTGSHDPFLDRIRKPLQTNEKGNTMLLFAKSCSVAVGNERQYVPSDIAIDKENISDARRHNCATAKEQSFDSRHSEFGSTRPLRTRVQEKSVPVALPTKQATVRQLKILHERAFWNTILKERMRNHNHVDSRTAEAMMNLANAHLRCKDHGPALSLYNSAVRIFRQLYHDCHISMAKPLDKLGSTVCRSINPKQNLESALMALQQALMIRHQRLGPHHVDTVDSLNNLAGFYVRLGELRLGLEMYYEVWVLRQAIFGSLHPSVAVTAHALGGIHVQLSNPMEAFEYFRQARAVYENMQLTEQHPTMSRLVADMASLLRDTAAKGGIIHDSNEKMDFSGSSLTFLNSGAHI